MTTPAIAVRFVGTAQEPVVVVDHFHPDPDALRRHAIAADFGPARHYYPGIRAGVPDDYFAHIGPIVSTVLHRVFAATARCSLLDASFSMVTRPPAALTLAQRLPHVDAVEPGRFALVHYLSPAGGDGTAFFRHRATGTELLDAARAPAFYARLDAELHAQGEPTGYVHGPTPLFERIAAVDARYNRAVIYRSALLHSGAISPDAELSADPADGRLTITAFLSVAAA